MTRHERGLLDTSVVILLDRVDDASVLPRQPLVSAVTLAELSVGPLASSTEERPTRLSHLQVVEAYYDPIPFDATAARALGQVAASLRRAGRKTPSRAYDAMIAATAIARGLPLYTCNPPDFRGIDGLDVVEVPVPPGERSG